MEIEAALIDGRDRGGRGVDFGVDAELAAGSQGKMFDRLRWCFGFCRGLGRAT